MINSPKDGANVRGLPAALTTRHTPNLPIAKGSPLLRSTVKRFGIYIALAVAARDASFRAMRSRGLGSHAAKAHREAMRRHARRAIYLFDSAPVL